MRKRVERLIERARALRKRTPTDSPITKDVEDLYIDIIHYNASMRFDGNRVNIGRLEERIRHLEQTQ